MIARSHPPPLDSEHRRAFLSLWAWLPFSRAERFRIAAAVLNISEDILRELVERDSALAADMNRASDAATDAVYRKLEEVALSDPRAARFRNKIAPPLGKAPRSTSS